MHHHSTRWTVVALSLVVAMAVTDGCGSSTVSESLSPSELSGTYQVELRHTDGSASYGECDSPIVRISAGTVEWHYTTCHRLTVDDTFDDEGGGEIRGDTLLLYNQELTEEHRFRSFTRSGATVESAWRGAALVPIGGGAQAREAGKATWKQWLSG